jgi:multidrug resistance efflux pump
MELIVSAAYFFAIWLIFKHYRLLRLTTTWKVIFTTVYLLAWLTEFVFLGQYAPRSSEVMVQAVVVPVAPEWGGEVTDVFVQSNQNVKRGAPLFQMDSTVWRAKVDGLRAQLAAADTGVVSRTELQRVEDAAARNAAPQLQVDQYRQRVLALQAEREAAVAELADADLALNSLVGGQHTSVAEVVAMLEEAEYYLRHRTVYAPSDGYVVNLMLHPGTFVRLKTPVMAFVSSDYYWLIAPIDQRGSQRVREGDKAEIAFAMYPGHVMNATVESVTWASGEAQYPPSGRIPRMREYGLALDFAVRLRLDNPDPDRPLRYGARGTAVIFTATAADILVFLRQLEIRVDSYLDILYNPFR